MPNFVFPNQASGQVGAGYTPGLTSNEAGGVVFQGGEIAVTAGQLTLNAVFGAIRVPKGAVIIGATLMSTDIDTNGSPAVVLSIGDAADDDRLIAGATVGQAGGVTSAIATTGFAYQYAAETLLQVKVKTAPATAAAGTLTYGVMYVTP